MKKGSGEKKFLIGLTGVVLLLTIFPLTGYAEIPRKINYQGYLTDAAGVPVNGTVQMVFSIYNVPTNGTQLWTETQTVSLNRGIYNVNLGDVNPITLAFDHLYYLGVKVGTDAEMAPRTLLTSVGYAFHALTAENGPPGPQGPAGPQGPQGPAGPQGPPGPAVSTSAVCVNADTYHTGECSCAIRLVAKVYSTSVGPCHVTSNTGECYAYNTGNNMWSGSCCVCSPW